MAEIVWWLCKAAFGGLVSYVTPRFLVAIGLPMDRWVVAMAGWAVHIDREAALWTASFVVAAALYVGSVLLSKDHDWRPAIPGAFRKLWAEVEPSHIIILGLVVALGGVIWQWKNSPTKAANREQRPPATKAAPPPEYVKDIQLAFEEPRGVPLAFKGTASAPFDRLRVRVDYASNAIGFYSRTRVLLSDIKDLAKGDHFDVPLVFRALEKGPASDIYWGNSNKNYPLAEINKVRLVIIGPDDKEQHLYFQIIVGLPNQPQPLRIMQEQELQWIAEWKAEDGRADYPATISPQVKPQAPQRNPQTEIIGGPYEPEELRKMILAMGEMKGVIHKHIVPANNTLWEGTQRVQSELETDGYERYINKIVELKSAVEAAYTSMSNIIFVDTVGYSEELRPILDDHKNSYVLLTTQLSDFVDTLKHLAKLAPDPKVAVTDVQGILQKDLAKIGLYLPWYGQWAINASENIGAKMTRMREQPREKR
jgi:hypothetical protein